MVYFIPRTTNFLLETKKLPISMPWDLLFALFWNILAGRLTMTPGLPQFSGNFDTVYLETWKEFVCSLN